MCGIAALFSKRPNLDAASLIKMMDAIKHRGPDDEGWVGFFSDGKDSTHCRDYPDRSGFSALLGHRRLSILDLSAAGHQPMCTEDGRYWIIHNGEVYNYCELRSELQKEGETFFSGSDTEVILKAYRRWGENALSRFNGMFAFVIFDQKRQSAFIARDRFGVKPLYIWSSPQEIMAVASEIKAFLPLPGWKGRLNGQRAYDFLNWGLTDHENDCLFEGVKLLQGGQYLKIGVGQQEVSTVTWYQPPRQRFKGSFQEASQEFRWLLQDSIQLRLRADVDVGSCLSGGLDSSAIVCLANLVGQGKRRCTFSACTENKAFDERPFIRSVVDATQVDSFSVFPSSTDLFDNLDNLIWFQDEPFGSTSIYAQWKVFELVKQQKIKVMLDGQGADEQMGGYQKFFAYRLRDLWVSGRWVDFLKEVQACRRLQKMGWPVLLQQLCPRSLRAPIRRLLKRETHGTAWLDLERLGAVPRDPLQEEADCNMNQLCISQVARTNLPMLLRYEDRDSMAHSVESRTPFLDYRLVELCLSLPDEFKLNKAVTKRVLREALKDVLPEEVRCRYDKIGFALPEEAWMKQEPEKFLGECKQAADMLHGAVKPTAITEMGQCLNGNRPFSPRIWRLICLGRWMKRFGVVQ